MSDPIFLKSPYQSLIDGAGLPPEAVRTVKPVEPDDEEATVSAPAPEPEAQASAQAYKPSKDLTPPPELRPLFEGVAAHYKVPVNVLMAIAHQESRYNPNAKNAETGASGMAQYLDSTAKSLGINPTDPNEAIPAAAMQLRERLDKGMSIEDAIKEHFAGPNRKLWGPKTAAYGDEVMGKARAIGEKLYGDAADAAPSPAPAPSGKMVDLGEADPGLNLANAPNLNPEHQVEEVPKTPGATRQNGFSPSTMGRNEYQRNFLALNPRATPAALDSAMAQYDQQADAVKQIAMDKAINGPKGVPSADEFFQQRLDKKLAAKQAANNPRAGGIVTQLPEMPTNAPPTEQEVPAAPTGMLDRGLDNVLGAASSGLHGAIGSIARRLGDTEEAAKQDKILHEVERYRQAAGYNDTVSGKVGGIVGGILPLMAAPEGVVANLAATSTLFGLPAYDAAYKRKIDEGYTDAQAKLFAYKDFVMNVAGPILMNKGAGKIFGQATGDVLSKADMAKSVGQATAEGAAFSAANTSIDKAMNNATGHPNDAAWIDPKDMLASGVAFAGMNAGHLGSAKLNEANNDPAHIAEQFGRALQDDAARVHFGADSARQVAAERMSAASQNPATITPQDTARQPGDVGPAPTTRTVPMPPEQAAPPVPADIPAQAGTRIEPTLDTPADAPSAPLESAVAQAVPGRQSTADKLRAIRGENDGVLAVPAPPVGPLTDALHGAAAAHAADPAPAPVMPQAEPAPPALDTLPMEDLQARLKAVAAQQKAADPAGRKALQVQRKEIEKAINAKAASAKADSRPAEEPLVAGPFEDMKQANKMMLRHAEETGAPHEVVPTADGQFRVQRIGGQGDGNAGRDVDGRGRGDQPADAAGAPDGSAPVRAGVGGDGRADAGTSDESGGRSGELGAADADRAAKQDANLGVDHVPEPAKVPEEAPAAKSKEGAQQTVAGSDAARAGRKDAAPAKPKKLTGKALIKERQRQRAEYFAPGNIVRSYGGAHDRVLGFEQSDDGGFSVNVEAVVKQGDKWVQDPKDARVRTHSTTPDERTMRNGPVERAAPQPAAAEAPAPTKKAQKYADVARASADTDDTFAARSAIGDYMNEKIDRAELLKRLTGLKMYDAQLSAAMMRTQDHALHMDAEKVVDITDAEPKRAAAPATAPTKKTSTAGERMRAKVAAENPFMAFLSEHGIHVDERSDTGAEKARHVMVPGFGNLYRKAGLRIDELATLAHEAGFLSDQDMDNPADNGGTRKLADMIERAAHRKEVIGHADRAEPASPSADEELMTEAEKFGIDIKGKSADQIYDEVVAAHADDFSNNEARLAHDAMLDADIPLDGGKSFENLSDEDIDAIFGIKPAGARTDGRQDQEAAGASARGRDAEAGAARADKGADGIANDGDRSVADRSERFGVEGRNEDPYTVDLFGGQDLFDDIEVRPNTLPAQKETARAAVSDLAKRLGIDRIDRENPDQGSKVSVLGARLLANFVEGKPNQLIGQKIASPHDLAVLAQVYRDPRFETFRVFHMKGDQVIGEAGYTSRLPAAVHLPKDFADRIHADQVRFEADGYYIIHNHPSGRAEPSPADQRVTNYIDQEVPGFRGHVVVDHNEYAVIQNWGSEVHKAPHLNGTDFTGMPEVEHALLGTKITGPDSVARMAKALQVPDGFATMVLTNTRGETNLMVDVPMAAIQKAMGSAVGRTKLKALLRRMGRESGSGTFRFLVMPKGHDVMGLTGTLVGRGIFTDVVNGGGESATAKGMYQGGDFMQTIRAKSIDVKDEADDYRKTVQVDGQRRPIENSNGKLIAQTPREQMTFWRWAKDTKAVDEQGRPLVLYHGTRGDFSTFSTETSEKGSMGDSLGHYFTGSPEAAGEYGEDGHVMPAYLRLKNPLRFDGRMVNREDVGAMIGLDMNKVYGAPDRAEPYWFFKNGGAYDGRDSARVGDAVMAAAREKGFDGAIFKEKINGKLVDVYMTFDADQIKSATGNNGQFDPANADIRYSATKTLDEVRASWEAAGIKNFVSEKNGVIHLSQIVVPKDARGKGAGTKAMQELVGYADQSGQRIVLTPSADFGGSKSRLVEFYKRFGFVENKGRAKDYEVSESMYRDPAGARLSMADHPMATDAARDAEPLLRDLADKGAIVLHDDASTLPVNGKAPAGVQALTTADGTIHVVASALRGDAMGVVLHEAFHAGAKPLLGTKVWGDLEQRLGSLYRQGEQSTGRARAFFDAARERVESAKARGAVKPGMEAEEFGAYAIEEYANAPTTVKKWVDDVIGNVKAWALKRFGKQLGDVTPAQLSSIAKMALLDKVKGSEAPAPSADLAAEPAFAVSKPGAPATPTVPTTAREKLAEFIHQPVAELRSVAHDIAVRVVPMATGSDAGKAVAKDFANQTRQAQAQWHAFDKVLREDFTKDQLEAMWQAADEENDLRRDGKTSKTKGLAGLPKEQREVVDLLHSYGEQLWDRAKKVGLVDANSDGVHYWTPRVAANIFADGSVERITTPGGEFSKDATNLKTSASSTKQRKHDTTADSEAALQAKHGADAAYVKNIRVMPLAMAQLEAAIAGRSLVNQVKAQGQIAGVDLISDRKLGKNYDTFDHPALKQWMPKTDWQDVSLADLAAKGHTIQGGQVVRANGTPLKSYRVDAAGNVQKLGPMLDSDGKPVMVASPLYVHKDFVGPLRAVLKTQSPLWYQRAMQLKGGVTSMIMVSPLTHNLVIWGKAMPTMAATMGWKNNAKNIATLGVNAYVVGYKARQNHAMMKELIGAGLVPVSGRGMSEDVAGIAQGIEPGRSWTAQALGKVADLAGKDKGDAVRRGVDKAGEFWHETLLWNRVADMQAGMAVMLRATLMDKGFDQDTANRFAAHFANRYAGMVPQEAMSQGAHMLANLALFSKSFNLTNVGAYKDVVKGLPGDVQAQIRRNVADAQRAAGKSDEEADATARKVLAMAQKTARIKGGMILALDIGAMTFATSLVQALWQGQDADKIAADFKKRAAALGQHFKESPLDVIRHPLDALASLSQTADNAPGKEDRVRIGEDKVRGDSYYARLPVGKMGEELKNYMDFIPGMRMGHNKMSTFVKPFADLFGGNEDFQGESIVKEHAGALVQAAQFGAYWIKSQLPSEDIAALARVANGTADNMDKAKLLGTLTGVTVGRVAGGDAVAEIRAQSRDLQAKLRDALPDAREAVRRGNGEEAMKLLIEAGQTPQAAQRLIVGMQNPSMISRGKLKHFLQTAKPEEAQKVINMMQRK